VGRPPCRPCSRWIDQIRLDNDVLPADLRRCSIRRGRRGKTLYTTVVEKVRVLTALFVRKNQSRLQSRFSAQRNNPFTHIRTAASMVAYESSLYFSGICCPVASVKGRAMPSSANYGELVEPRTREKRYGPRSFRVAALFVWNSLPSETMTLVVNNSFAI